MTATQPALFDCPRTRPRGQLARLAEAKINLRRESNAPTRTRRRDLGKGDAPASLPAELVEMRAALLDCYRRDPEGQEWPALYLSYRTAREAYCDR